MSNQPPADLKTHLWNEYRTNAKLGITWDWVFDILSLIAITSSVATSLLISGDFVSKYALMVLSSAPWVTVAVIQAMKVGQRARWHWAKATKLKTLYLRATYGGESARKISSAFIEYELTTPEFPRGTDVALRQILKDTYAETTGPEPQMVPVRNDLRAKVEEAISLSSPGTKILAIPWGEGNTYIYVPPEAVDSVNKILGGPS
jgi:hypothetical protein